MVTAHDVHPGATIVVPASYGGISDGCWDPDRRDPVTDLAVQMQAQLRGRALLRMYPGLGAADSDPPQPAELPELDDPVADREAVEGWLDQFGEQVHDSIAGEVSDLLRRQLREQPDRVELIPVEVEPGEPPRRMFMLRSKDKAWSATVAAAVSSEPATSSFLGMSTAKLRSSLVAS